MSTITIIEGNSNDKDNTRAYMVKGEKGVSPTVAIQESTGKVDIAITDFEGTHTTEISDPVVSLSKSNHVATISVTDKDGTRTTTVADGADLTDGAVPTGSVIGFDGETIPGGYEETNGFDNYSTTEHKVGTWTDGKPIYRKIITGEIDSHNAVGTYTRNFEAITNVDKLVKQDIKILSSTYCYPSPRINCSSNGVLYIAKVYTNISSNKLYVYNQLDILESTTTTAMPFEIIVEYTKSTD